MRRPVIDVISLSCVSVLLLATAACGTGTSSGSSPAPASSTQGASVLGKPGLPLAVGRGQDFATADGHVISVLVQELVDPATSEQQSRPGPGRRLVDVSGWVQVVDTSGTGLSDEKVQVATIEVLCATQ